MAPVKIKHIVSFTSQDSRYPAENLLLEESPRPWLGSPQDRSRQLKTELQLEQASHIGYIDIGNCGSAFLQIDVGRSSWPLDRTYLTLLPTTTLMMPLDAKLDKNRSGVRMFKEGDFLASTLGEKWDRVKLVCSQPFNKHSQFGLSFIRIRTPLDADDIKANPSSSPSQAQPEIKDKPWLSSSAFCKTFFPEVPKSTEEETTLKSQLQKLDPASMSRPARMVLAAACTRKRTFPLVAGSVPPVTENKENGQKRHTGKDGAPSSTALRSSQESSVSRDAMKSRRDSRSNGRRSGAAFASGSRSGARGPGQKGRRRKAEGEEQRETEVEVGTCPICTGCFPTDFLPVHAASCGEEDFEASPSSSPASWQDQPETCICCPICQAQFPASEVEGHASACGQEQVEPPIHSPSWWGVE